MARPQKYTDFVNRKKAVEQIGCPGGSMDKRQEGAVLGSGKSAWER